MCIANKTNEALIIETYSLKEKKERRRVQFGGVSQQDAEPRHCVCGDQKAALWYTCRELKAIRKLNRNIIRKDIFVDETFESSRGLEMEADEFRLWEVKTKIRQVLRHQATTRWVACPTSEALRSFASKITKSDRHRSVLNAMQDATEANRIYKETMNEGSIDWHCL